MLAVAFIAAIAVLLLVAGQRETNPEAATSSGGLPTTPPSSSRPDGVKERPNIASTADRKASSPEVPSPPPAPTAVFAPPAEPGVPPALTGLQLKPMDDSLRKELKVPEDKQIGYGVVIDQIHPDAPAAEISLQPGDVIVRAKQKQVNNVDELYAVVKDRDHTLLTISRQGFLFQVVIKRPFRPR